MQNLYFIQRWGKDFMIRGWVTEYVRADSQVAQACDFLLNESNTTALTGEPGTRVGALCYALCMAAHYDRTVKQPALAEEDGGA